MEVRQFTNISSLGSTTCTLTINKDSEGHYIRKETLISAFQLDEEEGVGIGPFGSSEYVCDEPKFRIVISEFPLWTRFFPKKILYVVASSFL